MSNSKMLVSVLFFMLSALSVSAKIWRVNNNVGVIADFTSLSAAVNSVSVNPNDTLHIEASPNDYGSAVIAKTLVVIGVGFNLDPGAGGNAGLQTGINNSSVSTVTINNGANGSKFFGITFTTTTNIGVSALPLNLLFEKCVFRGLTFAAGAHDGVVIRKCFTLNSPASINGGTLSNVLIENCIFNDNPGYGLNYSNFSGTGCTVRNNVIRSVSPINITNAYLANNIIISPNNMLLTNCNVKNNLFTNASQTLPGGAVNNQIGGAVTEANLFTLTGSFDARYQLKAGSPALGAGVTIAGQTPDCGAFGGNDPYRLSGIPPIPSIYLMTVPASIPSGSPTMNITFSSRNNN